MKKTILFSFLAAAITLTASNVANAQKKGFYVTAQGGPQISAMINSDDIDDNDMDYKSKTGASIGLGAGYNFNKYMGVGTEVMYSSEGQRQKSKTVDFTQRMSYLKVPVLFNFNTNPNAKIMFTAKAGPQLGILLDAKMKEKGQSEYVKESKDKYANVTFGGVLGVGASVNVAHNLYVNAGVRMDCTFTNSENEDYKGYKEGRASTYNFNTGLELGVKYVL